MCSIFEQFKYANYTTRSIPCNSESKKASLQDGNCLIEISRTKIINRIITMSYFEIKILTPLFQTCVRYLNN